MILLFLRSHPIRGAWIEMTSTLVKAGTPIWSHPIRGAWIEIVLKHHGRHISLSHPIRGAWIEIELLQKILQ